MIYNEHEAWHVSNRVFWRTLSLAVTVGREMASTPEENAWVEALSSFDEEKAGTYSPDVEDTELFPSSAQAVFWSNVLFDVARQLHERTLGQLSNADEKVEAIWAAYDLGLILMRAASRA